MSGASGLSEGERHDPTFLSAKGVRWATCTCGWECPPSRGPTGAQLAFGMHLIGTYADSEPPVVPQGDDEPSEVPGPRRDATTRTEPREQDAYAWPTRGSKG